MLLKDSFTLGTINGPAAKLRIKALKLHNYAELDFARGGNFGATVLAAFWDDQFKRCAKAESSGTPFDGLYLGMGLEDIRAPCYHVQAAVRISGNLVDRARLAGFCRFWRSQASFLTEGSPEPYLETLPGEEEPAPKAKRATRKPTTEE